MAFEQFTFFPDAEASDPLPFLREVCALHHPRDFCKHPWEAFGGSIACDGNMLLWIEGRDTAGAYPLLDASSVENALLTQLLAGRAGKMLGEVGSDEFHAFARCCRLCDDEGGGEPCDECNGAGRVPCNACEKDMECPSCDGLGFDDVECSTCGLELGSARGSFGVIAGVGFDRAVLGKLPDELVGSYRLALQSWQERMMLSVTGLAFLAGRVRRFKALFMPAAIAPEDATELIIAG